MLYVIMTSYESVSLPPVSPCTLRIPCDEHQNDLDPLTSCPVKVSSQLNRKLEIGPDTNVPVQGSNRISFLSDSHLSDNTSPFRGAGLLIAANSTDAVHFSCSIVGEMRTIGADRCVDGEIEDGVITYRSWSTFSHSFVPDSSVRSEKELNNGR